MTTVTLHLPPDTERRLRDQAKQEGQTLEAYLQRLAERAISNGTRTTIPTAPSGHGGGAETYARYISSPTPSKDEFKRLLSDLAVGPRLPVLPTDFSRADIYDDHD